MQKLEDFFHPGAGGDAHLFQVVAGKSGFDVAELSEEGLDMLTSHRGVGGQGNSHNCCRRIVVKERINAARRKFGVSQHLKCGFETAGILQGLS